MSLTNKISITGFFVSIFFVSIFFFLTFYPNYLSARENRNSLAFESLNQGYRFFISKNYHQALQNFKEALALEPGSEKAHYWIGKCYSEMGLLETAIHHWEQVIKLRKNVLPKDNSFPEKDLEAVSALSIKEAGEKADLARKHYVYGLRFIEEGKWDSGLAQFKTAARLDAARADYTEKIADIYMDKNLPALAVQYYEESIVRGGNSPELNHKLAMAYEQTSNLAQAVAQYRKALAKAPDNADFRDALERVSAAKESAFSGFARIIGRQDNEVIIDRGAKIYPLVRNINFALMLFRRLPKSRMLTAQKFWLLYIRKSRANCFLPELKRIYHIVL
jgi:tetratricopeptide (TPR) repeat protein